MLLGGFEPPAADSPVHTLTYKIGRLTTVVQKPESTKTDRIRVFVVSDRVHAHLIADSPTDSAAVTARV